VKMCQAKERQVSVEEGAFTLFPSRLSICLPDNRRSTYAMIAEYEAGSTTGESERWGEKGFRPEGQLASVLGEVCCGLLDVCAQAAHKLGEARSQRLKNSYWRKGGEGSECAVWVPWRPWRAIPLPSLMFHPSRPGRL